MWISEHARAVRDDSGTITSFQGTTIDITARKRAEEALQRVYDELEMRVAERTAELAQANDTLRVEIAERARAETELRTSHEQLRSLSACLQSIREEERTYIAREIHDELGQTLTALMMDLSWLEDRAAKHKDPDARRPLLEKTGDAKADRFLEVTFSKGLGRVMNQTATIELPDDKKFTAPTIAANQEYKALEPVITNDRATGAIFYAGVGDDPFFLDDTGANRFVASSIMNPGHPNKALLSERGGRDTYAGFNTLIIAVSVPAEMLRGKAGNVIGINAVTQRRKNQRITDEGEVEASGDWVTIDRDGNPLVNNGLIPPPRKNEYNAASTEDDAKGKFQADIVKSLKGLGTDDAHIAMLAKVAVEKGDILRLDLSVPNKGSGGGNNPDGGYGKMGGRRLRDDVVDGTFTIINNGVPLGDKVNGNDVAFRNSFPFVANPTQPFPPGSGADDRTRQ